jgi:hypothetical protein
MKTKMLEENVTGKFTLEGCIDELLKGSNGAQVVDLALSAIQYLFCYFQSMSGGPFYVEGESREYDCPTLAEVSARCGPMFGGRICECDDGSRSNKLIDCLDSGKLKHRELRYSTAGQHRM